MKLGKGLQPTLWFLTILSRIALSDWRYGKAAYIKRSLKLERWLRG